MRPYNHIRSYTAIYNHLQPYTTIYNQKLPYTAIYTFMCRYARPYTAIYIHIRPDTTIYSHIRPYATICTIYGHILRPRVAYPARAKSPPYPSCSPASQNPSKMHPTFLSFSLAAQNPPWTYNSIPSILSDFEANPWFCLLFAVSIQLPRTPPECVILPAFLQFYLFLKPMKAFAYFPTFRLGSWRPECFSRSVLFMLFPNLSSHFIVFLFVAVSWLFLLFHSISWYVLPFPAIFCGSSYF